MRKLQSQRLRLRGLRLLAGCAIVGSTACLNSTAPDFDPLDGRWTWIDAVGGIAGSTITPATEGYTMTVEFAGLRSTGARLRVLRDGVLFAETTVERSQDSTTESGTLLYGDPIMGRMQQEYTLSSGTALQLVDGCCDGFSYRFESETSVNQDG